MYDEIGAYEAKTKLPDLLRRVSRGKSFTITNHGKAVADIVPSQVHSRETQITAIENVLNSLKKKQYTATEIELKAIREAGRR